MMSLKNWLRLPLFYKHFIARTANDESVIKSNKNTTGDKLKPHFPTNSLFHLRSLLSSQSKSRFHDSTREKHQENTPVIVKPRCVAGDDDVVRLFGHVVLTGVHQSVDFSFALFLVVLHTDKERRTDVTHQVMNKIFKKVQLPNGFLISSKLSCKKAGLRLSNQLIKEKHPTVKNCFRI